MDEDAWQHFHQRDHEHIKQLKDMLERVAPRECVEDHEYSECVWCRKETEHNDFSLRKNTIMNRIVHG